MPAARTQTTTLVGLDIGGTKSHGVRWIDGRMIAEAKTGSANVQNVSVQVAVENIARMFEALGLGHIDKVVAGAGGIDTAADAQRLRNMIAVHAPEADIEVVHDSHLILAAGHASTGMAVILGTGSAVWGINAAGKEARAGGWGYLLGDEASGYWMGREAVRHTLRKFNREEPIGELGRLVLEANHVSSPDELIGLFHGDTDRRYWAQQSPLVFQAYGAGDAAATRIIDEAVAYMVTALGDVSSVLGIAGPVVIGGGLGMHQPLYQERLRAALAGIGLEGIAFLGEDPVFGALFLAGKDCF
ncbi:N-acetylglucosamine kinase [Paeniglutamicibacter gangotriensis]|uniref:N-acetylglucosamine kinase n=1 Tax=Paeniglutamicibacter gangotriensis TaxID=254787 RepID=UPI0037CAB9CB